MCVITNQSRYVRSVPSWVGTSSSWMAECGQSHSTMAHDGAPPSTARTEHHPILFIMKKMRNDETARRGLKISHRGVLLLCFLDMI